PIGVLLEIATRGLERRRELAVDELERMRREIVQRADRHAGLPSQPECRRLSANATGRSRPCGAPADAADSAVRPACSRAFTTDVSLKTPVVPVLSGSVKPATVCRSCDASSDSLLIAPEAAVVDSVVLPLISRRTCMFFVIAPAATVCSLAELEM